MKILITFFTWFEQEFTEVACAFFVLSIIYALFEFVKERDLESFLMTCGVAATAIFAVYILHLEGFKLIGFVLLVMMIFPAIMFLK